MQSNLYLQNWNKNGKNMKINKFIIFTALRYTDVNSVKLVLLKSPTGLMFNLSAGSQWRGYVISNNLIQGHIPPLLGRFGVGWG